MNARFTREWDERRCRFCRLKFPVCKLEFAEKAIVFDSGGRNVTSLTASVCTGCAANSNPAMVANPGRSAATTRLTLVTKMHAAACKATFVAWYHMGLRLAIR